MLAGAIAVLALPVVQSIAQETPLLRQGFDQSNTEEGRDTADTQQNSTASPVFSSPIETDATAGNVDSSVVNSVPVVNQTTGSVTAVSRSNTNLRTTNVLRQNAVGNLDANGQLDPRSNLPTSTVEGGGAQTVANPYAATGLRLGTFDLFPTLEQNVGYSSNADEDENGSGSGFSQTSVGLRLQSNWTIHQFQAELGATYQRFFNGESVDLPTANADASLRLDVGRDYTATFRGEYDLVTESASSANLDTGSTATITDRPNVQTLTASAELARIAGRLRFSLRGSLDKTTHEDATLSDGSKLLQRDRDNVLSSATARVSYQTSGAVSPFVEGSIGTRTFDIKVDRNGNQRDGNTYALRGGLQLDFGEKLTGQVAVGYAAEEFKDNNIATLSGLTFDSSLSWSPLRLTTITATATTTLIGSSNVDDNGSILYAGSLGISRQVRPQLNVDANLTVALQDYDTSGRSDVTLGANAGYTYWFNRFVAATSRVSYQTVDSSEAGSSYDVGTVMFGLRFQR